MPASPAAGVGVRASEAHASLSSSAVSLSAGELARLAAHGEGAGRHEAATSASVSRGLAYALGEGAAGWLGHVAGRSVGRAIWNPMGDALGHVAGDRVGTTLG